MRVFIWQQFSSNHSARFTVVGEFETPDAARKAAGELNHILTTIKQWYLDPENEDALAALNEMEELPLSPPEIGFSQQYDVEWSEYGLDWIWPDDQMQRLVTAVDRLVFVTSGDTWLGAKPVDSLVEHLGGMAMVDGSVGAGEAGDLSKISVDLACMAPDSATAEAVVREVNNYFEVAEQNHEEMFNTPWRDYNDARSFEYSTVSGKVWRDGERLRFEGLNFWHIGYGLPGLIAYLRDKGCTNIEYKLTGKNAMDIWQNHS